MGNDTVAPEIKILDTERGLVEIIFHYTSPIRSEIIRQLQQALATSSWSFPREVVINTADRLCDLQAKRNVCGTALLICKVSEAAIKAIRPCVKASCLNQRNSDRELAIADVLEASNSTNAPIGNTISSPISG